MDVATVLGLIGLVGIVPVVSAWTARLLEWRRVARILGLGRTTPVDLIVSTSGDAKHPIGTSRSYKTNVGEVQAMVSVARALGAHYAHKAPRIHMSVDIRNRLDSDLVVLGGPLLNDVAADFISAFSARYPTSQISHDAATQSMAIGDFKYNGFDLMREDGIPKQDLVLVLMGWDLLAKDTRDILCAGFTTYGTAAAAELLFNDLLTRSYRRTAKQLKKDHGTAIAASVRIVNKQCAYINVEGVWTFENQLREPVRQP
jgi:hypothetical protein